MLSGRGHKYAGIRWPMHPVPAALLGAQIRRVFSLLAPCGTGASAISVRDRIYVHDHEGAAQPNAATELKESP